MCAVIKTDTKIFFSEKLRIANYFFIQILAVKWDMGEYGAPNKNHTIKIQRNIFNIFLYLQLFNTASVPWISHNVNLSEDSSDVDEYL